MRLALPLIAAILILALGGCEVLSVIQAEQRCGGSAARC